MGFIANHHTLILSTSSDKKDTLEADRKV